MHPLAVPLLKEQTHGKRTEDRLGVTIENPPNAPTGTLKAVPALPTADDVPHPLTSALTSVLWMQPQWRAAPSSYEVFELSLTAGRHPPWTAIPASRRTPQRCHGSPVLPTVKIQLNNHFAHDNHRAPSPRKHASRRGYAARWLLWLLRR
jgi:hypothetical protein